MTYNSRKIKPLLILIVCMSILASISCISAADIDNAIGNDQNSIDINALDDQESVEPAQTGIDINIDDSADVSDEGDISADSYISHHHKNAYHHKNPENGSDVIIKHMHRHRHTDNDTTFEKTVIDDDSGYSKKIQGNSTEREILPDSIDVKYQTQDGNCKNTITHHIQKAWIATDSINGHIFLNFTCPIGNHATHECGMKEKGTCCCEHCQCCHDSHEHPHDEHKIIDYGNVKDDFKYSYNRFTQINNNRIVVIGLRDSDREETADPRNRNIKSLQKLIDDKSDLRDYGDTGNAINCDFALNHTDSMNSCLNSALKISLNSEELDIKDYNMEYYIFTNPYIIVKNIGVESIPLNINVENHCFNSPKANKTIAPTVNYNHSLFNDCITPTTMAHMTSLLFFHSISQALGM